MFTHLNFCHRKKIYDIKQLFSRKQPTCQEYTRPIGDSLRSCFQTDGKSRGTSRAAHSLSGRRRRGSGSSWSPAQRSPWRSMAERWEGQAVRWLASFSPLSQISIEIALTTPAFKWEWDVIMNGLQNIQDYIWISPPFLRWQEWIE